APLRSAGPDVREPPGCGPRDRAGDDVSSRTLAAPGPADLIAGAHAPDALGSPKSPSRGTDGPAAVARWCRARDSEGETSMPARTLFVLCAALALAAGATTTPPPP